MVDRDEFKTPSISTNDGSSSGSSDGSSSTPHTPPSPVAQLVQPESTVPVVPPQKGRYSANGSKKSPKSISPKSRLGVIDENSDAVSPDVPLRNPLRRFGLPTHKLFPFTFPHMTSATRTPPQNIYDDVEGPRGEKFSDLRHNNKTKSRRVCTWRRLVCVGLLIVILAAAAAIGLIVGLRRMKGNSSSTAPPNNATNSGDNQGFPAGQYSISTYLEDVKTDCVSNPSTWRCYPYSTYNESTTASLSTLSWIVNAQNGDNFTITSSDRTFSYTFQNVPLTLQNEGTDNELYTFRYQFVKTVIPSAPLTSDGVTTKCFFNQTYLIGNLYTKKAKDQALANGSTSTSNSNSANQFQPWPYALNFFETQDSGSGVPDCYKYVNGEIGESVSVAPLSSSGVSSCECLYTNFFS